jgi:hypothetical protein
MPRTKYHPPVPDHYRCEAVTKTGDRCKRFGTPQYPPGHVLYPGHMLCRQHGFWKDSKS